MYKMLGWNSRKPNERFQLVTESLKFNQQTPYLALAQKPLCEFSLSENTGCDSITSHLSGGCGLGVRGAGVAGKNASCPECRVGDEDWQVLLSEYLLSFGWQIPALLSWLYQSVLWLS